MLILITSLLAIAGDTTQAPPAPPNSPAALVAQVDQFTAQADRMSAKLGAIERYLNDEKAWREGRMPKGYVLPPMSDYLEPAPPAEPLPGSVVAPHPTVAEEAGARSTR